MGADMDWMAERAADRLDVDAPAPRREDRGGARHATTGREASGRTARPSPATRGAATTTRRCGTGCRPSAGCSAAEYPDLKTYGSVDIGPLMEKVWAARAGLGYVGSNGCLITEPYGSWVLLATLILDAGGGRLRGRARGGPLRRCRLCVDACPTGALDGAGRVDCARLPLVPDHRERGPRCPELPRGDGQTSSSAATSARTSVRSTAAPLLGGRAPLRPACGGGAGRAGARGADARAVRASSSRARRSRGPATTGCAATPCTRWGPRETSHARPVLEKLARDPSAVVSDAARWALARLPRC